MTDDARIFEIARANRLLAAEMFEALTPEQLDAPTLCEGWTARHVLAHLVPPEGGFKLLPLIWSLLRNRGDLDRMVDEDVRRDVASAPSEVWIARLRERAGAELTAPVIGAGGPLTDTAVHLRDVARPLGLDHNPPPEHWVPVLEFLCSRAAEKGFVPKGRARDLRVRPTDVDVDLGDPAGLEVIGTAEALAMTLAGRVAAAGEVDGAGAAMLRSRLGLG